MTEVETRRTWPVLRALLIKNWTIKRRRPFSTLSEILNPLLCILLFVALKKFEPDLEIPAGWATSNESASAHGCGSTWNLYETTDFASVLNEGLSNAGLVVPEDSKSAVSEASNSTVSASTLLGVLSNTLRIPRFYFTEATIPGLLLSLSLQAMMEGDKLEELGDDLMSCALKFLLFGYTGLEGTTYHVPSACRGKVIPYKIAIAPDTRYTREYFAASLETWYPRIDLTPSVQGISLLTMPSFADSHMFFDNESAMETYISSKEYGSAVQYPKVYAAIVFHEFPQDTLAFGDVEGYSIEYSLRFNSTGSGSAVPKTKRRRPNAVSKFAPADNTMAYATRGFMTLQTLVARFLNCMPTWDTTGQSTNGVCQIQEAVMSVNEGTDRRLLRQLENDMIISSAFALMNSLRDMITELASVSFSNVSVKTIPPQSLETLLIPMRIAPQPFHGAGVYGTPTQAFRYAPFFDKIALVFPIGFVLSYLYTVSRITVSFLMEKETRSRELMRIIGARDSELFGGWVLAYLPILVLATVLQAVGAHVMLFPSSDAKLLFIFFFTFATSSFGYGYLISTVFSRARAGSLVGMAIFFMMFFVSFSFNEGTSVAKRTVAALLPPISLSQGISVVAELESFGVGVNRDNAYELIKNFRFANAIGMQVLDTLLYILLGKYCEKVVPQEFGVAEKWYFFLMKKFWFPQTSQLVPTEAQINEETGNMVANSDAVEPVRYDLKQQEKNDRAVSIAGLRKEFAVHGGTKIAVHGLHLKFYEGEITCLLGHNGAGKTTVISMLTGMTPPTSGDAWVRGHSVVTGMRLIRRSLGYCPQHSVLYPTLTVKEHLLFYGRIKGFTNNKDLATEVTNKINEVGLAEKRDVSANALSGGMQRKLSLAIAFLGDSTVVFLDEPTAGMDPYSRRSTWELIQKNRVGRVVILTTHFMDEADILGDRIAIMAEGKLQCVGSSLFLKNRFGVGYRLCLMRQNGTHSQAIITLVQQYVPQAIVASDIGTELTFQLPFQASDGFPALFRDLEIRQYELNILSFAISVTTLEEIFLKVAESGSGKLSLNGETESAKDAKCDESRITQPRETVIAVKPQSKINTEYHGVERGLFTSPHVSKAFMNQMSALLRKRVLCGKRDFNMVFFSTILPVVAIFIGLSALKLSTILVDDPKLELSPSALFPLAEQTPVPFCCPSSFDVMSGGDGKPAWCSDVVQGIDGAVYELDLENVVYNGSATPTVFGVAYSSPSIDSNDTSGYNLRFGELVFEKGYGYADGAELNAPLTQNPMEGQYGGYIFYASETTHTLSYNVLANGSSTHAAPTYKHMIDSAIHRFLLSKASTSAKPNVTIRVSSHPLPLSFTTRSIFSSYLSFPAVICVVIGFTFIPASMMPFLVKEKQLEQNAKYQQLLSGMPFFAYWLSNFVFDVALYLVPMVATLLLLRGYGVTSSFSGADSCDSCTQDVPGATVALFVLFGTAIAPWTYLLSHVMKQPGECLLYTVMINFFVGLLLLLLSFTMDTLDSTRAANSVLVYIWRISPLFSLGDGLLKVLLADLLALFGLTTGSRSAFDADIAGTDIWYLLLECPLFILLTVGYDTFHGGTGRWRIAQFWTKLNMTQRAYKPAPCNDAKLHIQKPLGGEGIDEEIDGDVATEAQRVFDNAQTRNITSEVVQILKLEKVYANGKRAVKSLSFGLQQGECFGFLGVNGAGKTTTMKVLTGDLLPSSGTAMINGFDICKERSSARKSIGYCPQFDALIDLLTVREHLELFGRLKGFRSSGSLKKEVDRLLNKLQIQVFAGKLAGSLSGGNKRKLSLAIAMIGDPTVLVLDEPSTGVDPFSRRLLWDVILEASVQSRRSTVMLTTHSMEECEALCSKAGIMVDGGLRCFGSIPHLKARFGDGFMVEFKLETPNSKKVAELSLQVCDHLKAPDTAHFASAQLESVCAALGNGDRASSELITCLLTQQGRGGDIVDVASFCDWWLLEDRVQRLDEFLQAKFSGVMLLERQTDFCRYKVAGTIPSTQVESDSTSQNQVAYALSSMFELVEGAKSALGIKEYSLSQTSLEQIFNSFAHRRAGTELPH